MAYQKPAAIVRNRTIDEVVDTLTDPRELAKIKPEDASQREGGNTWAGASFGKSMEMLTRGWKEGVAKLDVKPHPGLHSALRPKVEYDVAGSEVDVGLFLAGIPECMGETVRRRRPAQVVRIGVDKAIHAGISKERILKVGRNVVLLVESLRMAGVPSEVWVCEAVSGRTITDPISKVTAGVYENRVCVQKSHQPIDLSRLAYWVGHSAALRRTLFAVEELEPQTVREGFGFTPFGGYGLPYTNYSKDEFDEWAPSPQESDTVIQKWVTEVVTRRVGV